MIILYSLVYLYCKSSLKPNKTIIWSYETHTSFLMHWVNGLNVLVWCVNINANRVDIFKIINFIINIGTTCIILII